jgi:hypothetical protein
MTATAQSQQKSNSESKTMKTESFKVSGNCGMCKERIEKAAKEEGAETASWDVKTKQLSVTFNPSQTSIDKLSKKMASVGHDTEKYKAPDDVYSKLPGCCHYERAK